MSKISMKIKKKRKMKFIFLTEFSKKKINEREIVDVENKFFIMMLKTIN